ncbi:YihY/virulence factor BrkB family protein [Nocardioides speluncae]|uniref:YihY/virulence factor BrkB family protein n=1 Tax=Nocardioides speluncae TaxID=2670337 RepID=UPI000D696D56|nr:YihY/virulence factor BrkB family protein [Nocardioides speluncae]
MPSLKDRLNSGLTSARARSPFLDHLVRTVRHYSAVKGNLQAGAVTYFGFLSFFPILALAFAVIGYVARIYPEAEQDLVDAINEVLPGMVGNDPGQIKLADIQDAAPGIASVGLVVVLYSGLGWLSSMRDALLVMFELPQREQPNPFAGKLRDLISLAMIGVTLIVSVAVSGVVTGFSKDILELVGLGRELSPLLNAVSVLVGLGANMLLFFALFRLLAKPHTPKRALWSGALLGAVGFEILKQLSRYLLASTKHQPAFQAFGIALILVVWIYYFSRVVMYAAAWSHTSESARELREKEEAAAAAKAARNRVDLRKTPGAATGAASTGALAKAFAAGGAAAVAVIALLRRRVSTRR